MIESLKTLSSDPGSHKIAVAYYYFDFTDPSKQTGFDFLRSVLSQIALEKPHAFEVASNLYTQCNSGQEQPTMSSLLDSILEAATAFEHLYIVIDAVDESPRDSHRETVLEIVENLSKHEFCHIAAASREEIDISSKFSNIGAIEVKIAGPGIKSDIHRYITGQFASDAKLKKFPAELKNVAQDVLSRKANGMYVLLPACGYSTLTTRRFRWVFYQLDGLKKCRTRNRFNEVLNSLPGSLSETYQQLLDTIDEEIREQVHRALTWVAFALRPLTIAQVAEAAVLYPEKDQLLDPDDRFLDPVNDLLEILGSLVTVRSSQASDLGVESGPSDTDIVTLAHYSVKEYFVAWWEAKNNQDVGRAPGNANVSVNARHARSSQYVLDTKKKLEAMDIYESLEEFRLYVPGRGAVWSSGPRWETLNGEDLDVTPGDADLFLSQSCLRYTALALNQIGDRLTPDEDEFPLFSYTWKSWDHHEGGLTETHKRQLDPYKAELLKDPGPFNKWREICSSYYLPPKFSQLHYAAHHDCPSLVRELLAQGADRNARDSHNRTPPAIAARKGFNAVVQVFLDTMTVKVLNTSADSSNTDIKREIQDMATHALMGDHRHTLVLLRAWNDVLRQSGPGHNLCVV